MLQGKSTDPHEEPDQDKVYDSVEMLASIAVVCFFYILGICQLANVRGSSLNVAVFVLILTAVPVASALAVGWLNRRTPLGIAVNVANHYATVVGLTTFAILPTIMHATGSSLRFWVNAGHITLIVVVTAHLLSIACAVAFYRTWPVERPLALPVRLFQSRSLQIGAFSASLVACMAALFQIRQSGPYPSYIFESLVADIELGRFWISAFAAATILTLAIALSGSRLKPYGLALWATALSAILYFDLSLRLDPFHYLTNIGPALHLDHGGKLMVDTFSQYGPGPVILTWIALKTGGVYFGSANILVQLFNLAFVGLVFFSICRMTKSAVAAMMLAVPSVGIMLAAFGAGDGNLNEVPSALGFRYLPMLCMVTAISTLPSARRASCITALASLFASLWSIEALVGALGIHLAFIVARDLRDRQWALIVPDTIACSAPAIVGVAVSSVAIRVVFGEWPDYPTYIAFLTHYSPLASFWGIPADGLFWGWAPMALAAVIVLADITLRAIHPRERILLLSDDDLFQRFFPMCCLLIITSAYFAGRAVDYTLVIATLPFFAIVIPAFLFVADQSRTRRWRPIAITVCAAVVAFWGFSVCFATFYRSDSPYASLIRECRNHCSSASFANRFLASWSYRPWFDDPRDKSTDAENNARIVRTGVDLINRWTHDQPSPIVLLGESYDLGSEAAFMYSGKWDRWPRSFAPLDQINPKMLSKILDAPVKLTDGDIAILRIDSDGLGPLEKGILEQVQSRFTLCRLPGSSDEVAAYRLTASPPCETASEARE